MNTAELLSSAAVLPASARAYREAGHWRDTTHLDDLRGRLVDDPGRTLLVDRTGTSRDEITAADLASRVERFADALRDAGVRPREAVGYQLANRWEAIALFHACARVGAVAVPMTTSLGPAQVEQRLGSTGAILVLVSGDVAVAALEEMAPRLPELRTRLAVDATARSEDTLDLHDDVLPATPRGSLTDPCDDEIGADDVALVLFTSGTTGRSKGVMHTANTLYASTLSMIGELLERPGDPAAPRVLTPSVVTHIIGIMTSALAPVVLGHDAVLTDGARPEDLLEIVDAEHVTHLLVGPTGFDALLDALGEDGRPPACLRVVALGGAPVADPVLAKARRMPVTIRIHWGMTEVPGGGASTGNDAEGTSWHTMGHPAHGLERVLGPADDQDGSGIGEVLVRGPQVTVGIVDSSDGSLVWNPGEDDGWFHTGDLAERDATGELAFLERGSDEVKGSSGMIIPTADVEDLVVSHPHVSEAVLVGFRKGEQSEAPAAVVVPRDGQTPTLDDIRAHLLDRGTTSWYLPERLELIDHLARDAQGKVDKRALRAWLDGADR